MRQAANWRLVQGREYKDPDKTVAAGEEGEDLRMTCDRIERTGGPGVLAPATVACLRDCRDDSNFQ